MLTLEQELFTRFGYAAFKPGQKEVITNLLDGMNTLAVLPTGTGKSLCYQFVGQKLEGLTVIVSPLLSLMEDQVRQLQRQGIKGAVALNSTLQYSEKRYILAKIFQYDYLFLSPEMLLQQEVLGVLQRQKIALFVVDEAHCVYQWGVDFRPEYSKLDLVQKQLDFPLTLALTATATPVVQHAIIKQLFSQGSYQEVLSSVNRKNIGLFVKETSEKEEVLLNYLSKVAGKIIIYCATRNKAEQISQLIQAKTTFKVAYYHGGLEASERSRLQEQFIDNQIDILCATNAFGMGIDKPDVRGVIHFDLPDSLENYLQEIGRAGRDGQKSWALLLYKKGDEFIHRFFLEETRANRATLKALIEGEKQAGLLENATELQQKWVQGYLAKDYSFEELEHRLEEKEKDRQAQLRGMLMYIETTTCRRRLIQTYFQEPIVKQSPETCCDNCALFFDIYQDSIVKSNKTSNQNEEGWRSKFLKLFKERD